MLFKKISYVIQVVVILSIFFLVLFTLVNRLTVDLKSESIKKRAVQVEKERIKAEFIANINEQYDRLLKLFNAKEYDKATEIIKKFNKYEKSEYKNITEIKKKIRSFKLKKKMDLIPKIKLNEFMKKSRDTDIDKDDSVEVYIRAPRYGQNFYISDLPVLFEGVASSVRGDRSEEIVWSSNLDGELGKGKKISVRLSIGEHQIAAAGKNGTAKGSMSINIIIAKEPDFLKKYIQK